MDTNADSDIRSYIIYSSQVLNSLIFSLEADRHYHMFPCQYPKIQFFMLSWDLSILLFQEAHFLFSSKTMLWTSLKGWKNKEEKNTVIKTLDFSSICNSYPHHLFLYGSTCFYQKWLLDFLSDYYLCPYSYSINNFILGYESQICLHQNGRDYFNHRENGIILENITNRSLVKGRIDKGMAKF